MKCKMNDDVEKYRERIRAWVNDEANKQAIDAVFKTCQLHKLANLATVMITEMPLQKAKALIE